MDSRDLKKTIFSLTSCNLLIQNRCSTAPWIATPLGYKRFRFSIPSLSVIECQLHGLVQRDLVAADERLATLQLDLLLKLAYPVLV